jgi:hypothetical protein
VAVDDLDELRPVLKPAQEHVLATLSGGEDEYFGRSDYEAIAHVSRSQAAYDLADLVKLGLVERVGSGRGTRYRIVLARGGRRRKWTPDRIRDELESFCDEIGGWPRAAEFKETGRGDLYLAASRYGGIEHWAEELGFREPEPEPEPVASSAPSRLGRMARTTRALVLATLLAFGLGLLSGSLTPADRPPAVAKGPMRTSADAVAGGLVAERQSPTGIALRLAAAGGGSWVSVRRGSADGDVVWQGTLARGKALQLHGRRLWLRLGAPENLNARLGGKRVGLPEGASTLVATRSGLRVLSSPPSPPPTSILVDAPAPTPVVTVAAASSPTPSGSGAPSPDPQPGGGGPAPDPQP